MFSKNEGFLYMFIDIIQLIAHVSKALFPEERSVSFLQYMFTTFLDTRVFDS